MSMHYTRDGDGIPIAELSDSHLINICRMLKRDSELAPPTAVIGSQWLGVFDADEIEMTPQSWLEHWGYNEYLSEVERRGLLDRL